MSSYQLATHVCACWTDDHVVLLDLRRNRYLGVDAAASRTLAGLIGGWPGEGPTPQPPAGMAADRAESASKLVSEMLRHGMIVTSTPQNSRTRSRTALEFPESGLLEEYPQSQPSVGIADIFYFLHAVLIAAFMLRYRPLRRVVERLESRIRHSTAAVSRLETANVRERVAVFERLQPFFFTARSACLLHSLALSEFLARYQLFPRFVIGVSTGPFAAHCWLQQGEVVFNDLPEHVRKFTPIMVR
jgi:hypothetical protein